MIYTKGLRAGLVFASCLALSACFGNSSGGAGGGGGTGGGGAGGGTLPASAAEFDTKFDQLSANTSGLAPTSTALTGTATFTGATKVSLFEAANPANTGEAIGALAVEANFDSNTISGTATNFQGTVNGQSVALTGTLDTATALAPSTLSEQSNPIVLPPGIPAIPGAPTSVTTNAFAINMGGELSDPDGVIGTVNLGLGGAFLGPIGGSEATAAVGPATVVVTNVPGSTGLINIGGAGEFYLERN
jgi:hypothetical protein